VNNFYSRKTVRLDTSYIDVLGRIVVFFRVFLGVERKIRYKHSHFGRCSGEVWLRGIFRVDLSIFQGIFAYFLTIIPIVFWPCIPGGKCIRVRPFYNRPQMTAQYFFSWTSRTFRESTFFFVSLIMKLYKLPLCVSLLRSHKRMRHC